MNPFHGQNYPISKKLSNVEHASFAFNVHKFCKPKTSCFMRETAVKRISFSLQFLMLHEVFKFFFYQATPSGEILFKIKPVRCLRERTYFWAASEKFEQR